MHGELRNSVVRQWRRFAKVLMLVAVVALVALSSAGVGESASNNGGGRYGTVNLAQGKGSPAALTDGDITSTAWNGWNILDLGSSYNIGKIVVYAMQAQWVRVSTSDDNVIWVERYVSPWSPAIMAHIPIAINADGAYAARYVKVLAGNNAGAWIGIAELEVYEWLPAPPPPPPASAYGTTNLALGRPTLNYYGSIVPSNPPGAAIDGNAGTSWRSNASGGWTTGGYAYGMIRIELAQSYKIGKIVLDPEQVHWYVIATSDSPGGGVYGYPAGSPWVFASYPELLGTTATSTEPRTFYFDGAVTAKYIWLQTWTWSGPAPGVSEIEVYEWVGDSAPPPSVGHLSGRISTGGQDAMGTVVIVNTSTGEAREVGATGNYSIDLPAGSYLVNVRTAAHSPPPPNPRYLTVAPNGNYVIDFHGPEAQPESYTVAEDTTLAVAAAEGVLANDSDPDADQIWAVLLNDVPTPNGRVTLYADGSFTYTPNPNFNGTDSFGYKVTDGVLQSAYPGTRATIIVTPANNPPVAVDDSAQTDEDSAVTVPVLANDSDVDRDALTVASVTPGAHGLVTNNGGSVTYTPAANFNGADSFTYTASDGNGGTASATVNVTVKAVNDPPVAVDDVYSISGDASLIVPVNGVLANDVEFDGDALAALLVAGPADGSLTLRNDGSLSYSPGGFIGTTSFTYRTNDGTADSNVATVTIIVTPPPPTTGKITGGVLRFGNNGRGGFNVQAGSGGTVKGEMEYHNGSINLHAKTMTALAISEGRRGWFSGVLDDGSQFAAYVEDNGEPGAKNAPTDVFKLWVEGTLQNGDGRLTGGNAQIHKQ